MPILSVMLGMIIANGGPVLVAIGLASVVGLAVALERAWRLLPLERRQGNTWARFEEALAERGLAAAVVAVDDGDPVGRVVRRAARLLPRGPEAVRVAALTAAQQEAGGLERGLGVLAVVAQVTPLLGLLGTVTGLILAFAALDGVEADQAALAGGVHRALGTTAAGLAVAIPAHVIHGLLAGLVARQVDRLERIAGELAVLVARP